MHKSSWLLLPPILEFLNTHSHIHLHAAAAARSHLCCIHSCHICRSLPAAPNHFRHSLDSCAVVLHESTWNVYTESCVCRYTTSCWWADLLWACLCVILIYTIFACETVIANCNHISLPLSCGFTLYYTRTQTQPLTPWKHAQLIPVNTQCCWVSRRCLLSEIEITINWQ